MKAIDPKNHRSLKRQLAIQRQHNWDLESDIPWHLGVDIGRLFLPLDDRNIAFPNASMEQRLALSQFMGLVVNATIAEMEDALPKLRFQGWEKVLRSYPTNPELWELGDLFFEEEAKHARAFNRYLETFCLEVGVEQEELRSLLPQAFGSFFQKAITTNSEAGGHAFWWVVASVEEVSINIFHAIRDSKEAIDPLFFVLHQKHLEEESRHANYAHLMLALIRDRQPKMLDRLFKRTDFVFAQLVSTPWVLTELYKFFHVKKLAHKHPFFQVLASCIPLFQQLPKSVLVAHLFRGAPYISWLLNPKQRKFHAKMKEQLGAWAIPYPAPRAETGLWTGAESQGTSTSYGNEDFVEAEIDLTKGA